LTTFHNHRGSHHLDHSSYDYCADAINYPNHNNGTNYLNATALPYFVPPNHNCGDPNYYYYNHHRLPPITETPSPDEPFSSNVSTSTPSATSDVIPATTTVGNGTEAGASPSEPVVTAPVGQQQEATSATSTPSGHDVSVNATSEASNMSTSAIIMFSCIGMAGVVAMALVVVVYRKLSGARERKDDQRTGAANDGIVVLGQDGAVHTAFNSTRCLQVI
ncbi:hypothetical protein AaE_000512, partial [Aphanomyces astaci]